MIEAFHFLRPWWLAALVPAIAVLWALRRHRDAKSQWSGKIAPHLLGHLIIAPKQAARGRPILTLGVTWLACTVALAGPSWKHEPAPFADDTAAMVIVLRVTPTMRTTDVPPDRLARSVQKIRDLLALRPGAKTSLIAYSGSAHVVMPLTSDANIINTFSAALDPKIMPVDGDAAPAAIEQAEKLLRDSGQAGSVLWITDAAPKDFRPGNVRVFAPLPDGTELRSLQAIGNVTAFTPDDADVKSLASQNFTTIAGPDTGSRWADSGYFILPAVLLASMLWFRRGVLGAMA